MSQVIAGLYELGGEIGAGGGGIVYLGRHLRLKKPVVLKADKRTLSTGGKDLMREVELLKNLSHTFIPQVYDFVQEDGVVYTVMDYIEGESLDKLLDRRALPKQPQVIQWAVQILEALCYLHRQPPHGILHGDIKPANIMLRPNGEICLIDFNIALALGEEGAVKVGFSRGYASPEHYGADYIERDRRSVGQALRTDRRQADGTSKLDGTLILKSADKVPGAEEPDATVKLKGEGDVSGSSSSKRTGSSGKGGILLDVRSDIYCLGATLYHLLSGVRPAQDARDVAPLGPEVCSPAVSAILQKAMAPEPDKRYQTAEEMRDAFVQLHKQDPRAVRHRRRMAACAGVLSAAFLLGGASAFVGQSQLGQIQEALALSEYSANALAEGDVSGAVGLALQAIPTGKSILDAPVTAQAQKALTDALGVYDLSDGFRALDTIELPAAPFDIAVSPGGTRFAAVYAFEVAVYDLETQRRIAVLPTRESALSGCVFVDESRIVYAGEQGVTAYDLDAGEVIWTGRTGTTLALSADGKRVAAVDRKEDSVAVYRVSDGGEVQAFEFNGMHMSMPANDIFANPKADIFALNEDGSILAVSFSNGGLMFLDVEHPEYGMTVYEESDYGNFQGGFRGRYFAFAAGGGGGSVFGMIDMTGAQEPVFFDSGDELLLRAGVEGFYLAEGGLLVALEPDEKQEGGLAQRELARTGGAEITAFSVGEKYVLAAGDDNSFSFYDSGANPASTAGCDASCDFVAMAGEYAIVGSRNGPALRLLKLEGRGDVGLLSYDARYPHSEARVSQDGRTVMLFDYQGFRVYDMAGNLLAERELPEAENIYDQQFVKGEESWLEVVWYDGTRRRYGAADGALRSEEAGEAPGKDLYEEFFTERYRFASGLHSAPEAYDRKTGKLAAVLEQDSYLTYVTQAGEYIITEYISASGERYGILLDGKLRKLAVLPKLCDVAGDRLVFDYESGDLRQSRIYSLEELMRMGEEFLRAGE